MAVRPLMISASSENPVIRLASQDRNSLRRSQLAASLSRAVDCLASVMSSMTCLPGAVDCAGAGGAAPARLGRHRLGGRAGERVGLSCLTERRARWWLVRARGRPRFYASSWWAVSSLTAAGKLDVKPCSCRRGMRGCVARLRDKFARLMAILAPAHDRQPS